MWRRARGFRLAPAAGLAAALIAALQCAAAAGLAQVRSWTGEVSRRACRAWAYTQPRALALRAMHGEAGQSMVEYAVLLALIAVASMVAVQALGGGIALVFQGILGRVQGMVR